MSRHLQAITLLVALCVPLFFAGASSAGFSGTDELRYGQIAKELEPGRDLFLLHFNGERYSDKPPLYFWTVALAYKATGGVSPFGLRLPGILSGIACVVLCYLIAHALLGDRRLAFASACVLMVMPRFVWILHFGRLDILMCVFVFGAMLSFVRRYFVHRSERPASWAFWIGLGLSCAVKGPAGPIVLIGAVVTFIAWNEAAPEGQARLGLMKRIGRGFRRIWHPGGVAAAVGLNLAWIAPIVLLGDSESSSDLLISQNIGRVINPWRHVQPPWYYLINIGYNAFPAAIFAVWGLFFWWRRHREGGALGTLAGGTDQAAPSGRSAVSGEVTRPDGLFGERHAALRLLVSWFGFAFVFFSIYLPKRAQYLLPMYPAIAIFAVVFLERLARDASARAGGDRDRDHDSSLLSRYFALPATLSWAPIVLLIPLYLWLDELAAGLVALIELVDVERAFYLAESAADFEYSIGDVAVWVKVLGALGAAVAGVAFVVAVRGRAVFATLGLLVGVTWIIFTGFFFRVVPAVHSDAEMRVFARLLEGRLAKRPDLVISVYGETKPFYNIYGDFPIRYFDDEHEKAYKKFMAELYEEGRPFLTITEKDDAEEFAKKPWATVAREWESTMDGDEILVRESP